MDIPPDEYSVLVCLPPDERRAAAAFDAAARLAGELKAPLSVVNVYPAGWNGPLRAHPSARHLMSDEPEEALSRFVARGRFTHVVFASSGLATALRQRARF